MRSRLPSFLAPVFLLVILLAACGDSTSAYQPPTVQPTVAPPRTEYLTPYGCLPAITITDFVVQACMNRPEPAQYETLMITTRMSVGGMPIAKAPIKTTWDHSTGPKECSTTSNAEGIGFCSRNIGNSTIGFRVLVEVQVDYNGQGYRGETSFTPNRPGNPPSVATAEPAPASLFVQFYSVVSGSNSR